MSVQLGPAEQIIGGVGLGHPSLKASAAPTSDPELVTRWRDLARVTRELTVGLVFGDERLGVCGERHSIT